MCNLYSNTTNREAMLRLFRVSDNRADVVSPLQAIFPSNLAPVVRLAPDGERELRQLNWGFVRRPKGKGPSRVGNIRDDKALVSPFWKESFRLRRCLVPATSYCEPKGLRPAVWHWFSVGEVSDLAERPLFAFPGVWRTYVGPVKKDGLNVEQDVFAFMTTVPNALTSSINHDRMPCLLTREDEFETWMRGTPEEAFALVRPFPAGDMRIVQAGAERRDMGAEMLQRTVL